MLLRYKSGQSEVSSSFQMLVNNLTETISEKELQLNEAKKVNRNLLEQLRQAREREGGR
jgi:flagellar hook-associated protein FlgK